METFGKIKKLRKNKLGFLEKLLIFPKICQLMVRKDNFPKSLPVGKLR